MEKQIQLKEGWLLDQINSAHREVHAWHEILETLYLVRLFISEEYVLDKINDSIKWAEQQYTHDMYVFNDKRKHIANAE